MAIFVLLGALAAVLIPLLVVRANTQSFAARSDGGRDIHVFLQPQATGPEVNALEAEVARANGVSSDRVRVLPVSVEFSQEFGSAGNSMLPCCGKQNLTYYLDVMVTSPNRVSPVESGIIGRPAVLAVADARQMVAAKFGSYKRWRDLAVGAWLVITTVLLGLVMRRPRSELSAT